MLKRDHVVMMPLLLLWFIYTNRTHFNHCFNFLIIDIFVFTKNFYKAKNLLHGLLNFQFPLQSISCSSVSCVPLFGKFHFYDDLMLGQLNLKLNVYYACEIK